MSRTTLKGVRVLLVEDQMIVALEVESILETFGCVVVGPAARLDAAIRMAREEALDAAILDVNLDGVSIDPVVKELRARGVPILLVTGYGASMLPDPLQGLSCLEKPIRDADLEASLIRLCQGRERDATGHRGRG